MPIYDYECRECRNKFEEFARITDPPAPCCPACKSENISRLISGTFGNVEMNGRDYFKNVIEPEAKRIADRINKGDEDALADVLGEEKMK